MSKITTTVEAYDLISQLGKELVTSYEAENQTVTTIVTALLAFQVLTPAITLGTISGSYSGLTRSIKVDGDTVLRALFRLRDTVGGYIYVDNDRKLQWADSIGEDKGQQIRYRKNLKGIERNIDYNSLVNRLYCYGAGEGTARIKLSDADGHAEDYVEDVTSQGAPPAGWGGIYIGQMVDRSITHPNTLLAWATLKLAEVKDPIITYSIDTIDLSELVREAFDFEALQLGSTVKVIDEELGIDVSVTVVRIEHPDLLHPEQMNLELATRVKDITDTLSEVYDRQQFDHHVATIIGAGQVIVQGVFTVKDWVTAGETTIDGGQVTTDTIVVNTLTSGTLTNRTITLGVGAKFVTAASPNVRIEISKDLIAGYSDATTKQFYLQASDGKAYAGGGKVVLDSDGILLTGEAIYFKTSGYAAKGWIDLAGGIELYMSSPGHINLFPHTGYQIHVTSTPNLGSSTNFLDTIYYKTLSDQGCPLPISGLNSPLSVITQLKTHKITKKQMLKEAKSSERLGKRAIERLASKGSNELVEEWDLSSFPKDILQVPKDISGSARIGIVTNELLYVLVKATQELADKIEALEAK